MGMFDWIRVEMPLPESEKPLPDNPVFQTKSTPGCCFMDTVVIRADGTLLREGYTIEDRSDPDAQGWERVIGFRTRIREPSLDETYPDFHGDVYFYHYVDPDHDWVFRARFTEGVCTSIIDTKSRRR